MLSLTCSRRQNATSSAISRSSIDARREDEPVDVGDQRPPSRSDSARSTWCSPTTDAWMSENSSSFRRIERASAAAADDHDALAAA